MIQSVEDHDNGYLPCTIKERQGERISDSLPPVPGEETSSGLYFADH